jgi:hypothetical protein
MTVTNGSLPGWMAVCGSEKRVTDAHEAAEAAEARHFSTWHEACL